MKDIDTIPKIPLAVLPTPLQEARRLAQAAGLSRLYIKRDDLTGLAGGGNKARKLEFDFAEILDQGCDVVITAGGIQSNHARMTAAAARKLGLEVKLVLGGADFDTPQGNLLLDLLFDAEIRYLVDNDENANLEKAMDDWAAELRAAGRKPAVIPLGGSSALGALGYVTAMRELSTQLPGQPLQIVIGAGSCGTLAGTLLGARIYLPDSRIIGISVSRSVAAIRRRSAELVRECAAMLDYSCNLQESSIECYDEYAVEYGRMTPAGEAAILTCARLEGIVLDPIYTGKVMAGLLDLTRRGIIDREVPVVFMHTGGTPILFAFASALGGHLKCTRIYPDSEGPSPII